MDCSSVYRYHLLRAALGAGEPGLAELDGRHLADICRQADKSFELESLVLSSQLCGVKPPGNNANAVGQTT